MSTTGRLWKRIFIGKNYFYTEKSNALDFDSHVPLAYPFIGLLASIARNTNYSITSKIFGGIFLAIAAAITTPITFVFFSSIALLGTLITAPVDLFSPSPKTEPSAATFAPNQTAISSINNQQALLYTALPQGQIPLQQPYYYQPQSTLPSAQAQTSYYNSDSTLFSQTQSPPDYFRMEPLYIQTTPGQGW